MNEDEIGTSVFHLGKNVVQTAYIILVRESYRIKNCIQNLDPFKLHPAT